MLTIADRVARLEQLMQVRESEIKYLSKIIDMYQGHPERSACTEYDEALAKLDHEFPGSEAVNNAE